MTISVLMSVYKNEQVSYLHRALQSVWDDQTLKPDQIVLIEDGPLGADLSSEINQWQAKLGNILCLVRNPKNLGLAKSLNIGIAHVTSDLIARMDSDDISAPERFRLQHDYLAKHPEIHIVGGSLQEFDSNNEKLNVRYYPLSPKAARTYIQKASPLAHPTVMMRKQIFDEGLSYNEKYRTSQDLALWYDALVAGYKISNVPQVTIYFRLDNDFFTRRGKEKAWNEFKINMKGICRLFGPITPKYILPISRLVFRMMPSSFVKFIYSSKFRKKLLN